MHKCELCNYETYDSGNFTRHKNTKKHVQNDQKSYIQRDIKKHGSNRDPIEIHSNHLENTKTLYTCQYCEQTFKHKTNLYRHQKHRCEMRIETINEMKENMTKLEKQNQELIDIVKSQSKSAECNAETIKKSVSALSYVTKQYPNAPPIEELEYDKFNKITKCLIYDKKSKKKINYSIEEVILFYFKNDKLPEILGKAIVEEYKKNDPCDQSMWASDVSRLAFIVKSAIGKNKKSKWISDKNGVHFTELIIRPMFEIIKEKMKEYIKNGGLEESEIRDEEMDNITSRLANMQLAGELIRLINLNKYDAKVLKYVTPYFNLNIDELSNNSDSETENDKLQKKSNIKFYDRADSDES